MPRNKKNKGGGGGNAPPPRNTNNPIPMKAPDTQSVVPVVVASEDNEALKIRLAEAKDRLSRVEAVIETIGAQRQTTDAAIADAAQKLQNIDAICAKPTVIENVPAQPGTADPNTGTAKKNKKHNKHKIHNLIPPEGFPAHVEPKVNAAPTSDPKPIPSEDKPIDQVVVCDHKDGGGKNKKKNKNKNKQQLNEEPHVVTPVKEVVVETKEVVVETKVVDIKVASLVPADDNSQINLPTPDAEQSVCDGKKKKNKNKNKHKNKEDILANELEIDDTATKIVAEVIEKSSDITQSIIAEKCFEAITHLSQNESVGTSEIITDCQIKSKKKNKNKQHINELITKDPVQTPVESIASENVDIETKTNVAEIKPSEPLLIIKESPLTSTALVQSVTLVDRTKIETNIVAAPESLIQTQSVTKPETKEDVPCQADSTIVLATNDLTKKGSENIWKILDPPTDVAVIEGNVKNKKVNKIDCLPKSELSNTPKHDAVDTVYNTSVELHEKSKPITKEILKDEIKHKASTKKEKIEATLPTAENKIIESTDLKTEAKNLEKSTTLIETSIDGPIDNSSICPITKTIKVTEKPKSLEEPQLKKPDNKSKLIGELGATGIAGKTDKPTPNQSDVSAKTISIAAVETEAPKTTLPQFKKNEDKENLSKPTNIVPEIKPTDAPKSEIINKSEIKSVSPGTPNPKNKIKNIKPTEQITRIETEVQKKHSETKIAIKGQDQKPLLIDETKEIPEQIVETTTFTLPQVKDANAHQSSSQPELITKKVTANPIPTAVQNLTTPLPSAVEAKATPIPAPRIASTELKAKKLSEIKLGTPSSDVSSQLKSTITSENKTNPPDTKSQIVIQPKAEAKLVEEPIEKSPNDKAKSTKFDEPTTKKDAKQKNTKIKSKAPQPPRTEESPAPSEVSSSSASTIVEVGNSSGSVVDENVPILSDSKNVQRSVSVRSVDVAAVTGPTTESLHNNKKQVEDADKDTTISAESAKAPKNGSPTNNKRTKNEINLKQFNETAEAKTNELPAKSAQQKLDPVPTNEVQLMDILEPKMSTGTKPGAVAGNVRVKASSAAPKMAPTTVKKEPISKDTGAIPKTGNSKEKIVSSQPTTQILKQLSSQEVTPNAKAASPKRDMPIKQGSPMPVVPSSNDKIASPKPDNKKPVAAAKSDAKLKSSSANTTGSKSPPPKTKTTTVSSVKPIIPPKPNNLVSSPTQSKKACSTSASSSNASTPSPNMYDDEEYVEYKFSPRPVFMSTICQTCKIPLQSFVHCKQCMMISYCTVEHLQEDGESHQPLCAAIQEIAKKRGGHIYNNARILNDDDYRSLRVHTLNLCENSLKRHLQPFEREILLFPRLCSTGPCREWRQHLLTECKICGQVSYCASNPEHLAESHAKWCQAFALYQKLVVTQKHYGRIEPSLPSKIMSKEYQMTATIDETFRNLYKNYGAIKDECTYAALTQLATAPLTAYYGIQLSGQPIGDRFTIHLVGAELQFEADTLDKWETFFLHLAPQLVELRIVFVGPELNAENLPLEILSRIRMCRACRQNCRAVKFDFQCGTLYHTYVKGKSYTKPDLICFFNPGLYRSTGFNGQDTWPDTIQAAMSVNTPVLITSYTEVEAPRDLDRLQKESARPLTILKAPHINPFASQRPERNFISDEVAPMIFKNFYCFVCK